MIESNQLDAEILLEKTRCALLNPGDVIYYKKKLWVVLNPAKEKKAKLIRSLLRDQEGESMIMPGKTIVKIVTQLIPKRSQR